MFVHRKMDNHSCMWLLLSSSKAWDPRKQNQVKTTEVVVCRSADICCPFLSCSAESLQKSLQSPSLWQSPWALHPGFPGVLAMGVQQGWTTGWRWKVQGRQSQIIDIFSRCAPIHPATLAQRNAHFHYTPTSASLKKKKVNWSIVDLQCCASFWCIAKWFSYT